jgi:N-carbamoyl-L-amino-acid hydrolase
MLSRCYELAHPIGGARATIGVMEAVPGSNSTIPHTVNLPLDLRHPHEATLPKMVADFEEFMSVENDRGFEVTREVFGVAEAQDFDEHCVQAVREGAIPGGYRLCDIISGSGHDAVYVN